MLTFLFSSAEDQVCILEKRVDWRQRPIQFYSIDLLELPGTLRGRGKTPMHTERLHGSLKQAM